RSVHSIAYCKRGGDVDVAMPAVRTPRREDRCHGKLSMDRAPRIDDGVRAVDRARPSYERNAGRTRARLATSARSASHAHDLRLVQLDVHQLSAAAGRAL